MNTGKPMTTGQHATTDIGPVACEPTTADVLPAAAGEPGSAGAPLVRIRALRKTFALPGAFGRLDWRLASRRQRLIAVDGIDLDIHRGECFALVGESGSGKTTVARLVAGLDRPDSGTIELSPTPGPAPCPAPTNRGLAPQMVFQDPHASLNPRWSVARTLAEPIRLGGLARGRTAIDERIRMLLQQVGMDPADASRYPHQFSGGQRQRISIARALAAQPALLICDEPTSALDVSVQAQILALLDALRRERGLTMLFVSHDLAVVRQISDRVAVMKAGRIVETGPTGAIFAQPRQAYTAELLAAVPNPFADTSRGSGATGRRGEAVR